MKARTIAMAAILVCLVSSAIAQSVSVGKLTGNHYGYKPEAPFTLVDLSARALVAGNLTTATLRWDAGNLATCTGAFKVKIIRPPKTNGSTAYTLVAERGPFDSSAGYLTVPLDPPIAVQVGDLLAIAQIKQSQCGGVATAVDTPAAAVVELDGDFAGPGPLTNGPGYGFHLMARASASADVLDGVITAGGAVAGNNGSFFRTSVQLTNLDSQYPIAGKIVFHPAGRSAAPDDPSVPYSLAAGASTTFPDIVATMNATGLGTLDLVSTNSPPPLATIRVFDDQGSAGTKGFTEEALPTSAALLPAEEMVIAIPADLANYRVNVGLRTLDAGAQVFTKIWDAAGVHGNNGPTKTYAPNYFEQAALSSFIGMTPPAGGMVQIHINSGSAIVYWSTTDNRTNDSAIKFAIRP